MMGWVKNKRVLLRLKSGGDWPSEPFVSATAFQLDQKTPLACVMELGMFIRVACDNMGSLLRTYKPLPVPCPESTNLLRAALRVVGQRKHAQSYLGSLMHSTELDLDTSRRYQTLEHPFSLLQRTAKPPFPFTSSAPLGQACLGFSTVLSQERPPQTLAEYFSRRSAACLHAACQTQKR